MATYSRSKTWEQYGRNGVQSLLGKRSWQIEKPFKRPNPNHPFTFNTMWLTSDATGGYAAMSPLSTNGLYNTGTYNDAVSLVARNKALTKLQTDFGEAAMALVNIAERKQAYNMLLNRSLQLLGVLRAIRKRDEILLAAALSTTTRELERARKGRSVVVSGRRVRKGNFRQRAKDVSATWLEYHFGWEPLVKDIYNSVKILQSPYDPRVVVKRATTSTTVWDGNRNWVNRWRLDRVSKYGWRCSAKLTVSNPNLFRASQLGLVNPAAVAWELVPFSFVVDWFLPVGEFLNSYSNLFGVTVQDPLTTVLETTDRTYATYWSGSGLWGIFGYRHVICDRQTSLPPYSLRLKQFKGFSVARGATAIALLIQQLKSHS